MTDMTALFQILDASDSDDLNLSTVSAQAQEPTVEDCCCCSCSSS